MNWEPAHADHSIESVNAVFSLATPIDPDAFDEILVGSRKVASAHQFLRRVEGIEPLQVNAAPGAGIVFDLMTTQTRRRVAFQRIVNDQAIGEFAVGSSSFSFTTAHYISWKDFRSMVEDLLQPAQSIGQVFGRVTSIQLQYIDRFGSQAPQPDPFEIVSAASALLAPLLSSKKNSLHCHTGWYDYPDDMRSRLTNVRIDMMDSYRRPGPVGSRLGILTMARLDSAKALENPLDELSDLHYYLKALFRDIITTEAAARVHLYD